MSSTESADDTEARELHAARRTLVLLIVAVGAAVAAFVAIVFGIRGDDGSPEIRSGVDDPVVDATLSDDVDRSIGPVVGADVGDYIAERSEALRGLEGQVVAVVSLTGYSTESTVADLHDGLELDSYLIALPGGGARRTTDIDETVAAVVAEAEPQLAELVDLLPTVEDDPEFAEFYASEIERLRRVVGAAEHDDVVFGLVVTGAAADLRSLASRASVRLVDARDDVDLGVPVAGLRPEERLVAAEPPFRP